MWPSLAENHIDGIQVWSEAYFVMLNKMKTMKHQTQYIDFGLRLFDKNGDGLISKKEFRWMTTSAVISPETIDCIFKKSGDI